MALQESEKKALLKIARETMENYIRNGHTPSFSAGGGLLEKRGAFVTIKKDGNLRGCIGIFNSEKTLYRTVSEMAISSATQDPRFPPLPAQELPAITIEISALTPLKKISDVNEIEIGRHGVYIIKGLRRGVLLPQVATEYGFDRDTFLDQTCLKAGLSPGCWRTGAEIHIFEAEIFSEAENFL